MRGEIKDPIRLEHMLEAYTEDIPVLKQYIETLVR